MCLHYKHILQFGKHYSMYCNVVVNSVTEQKSSTDRIQNLLVLPC